MASIVMLDESKWISSFKHTICHTHCVDSCDLELKKLQQGGDPVSLEAFCNVHQINAGT